MSTNVRKMGTNVRKMVSVALLLGVVAAGAAVALAVGHITRETPPTGVRIVYRTVTRTETLKIAVAATRTVTRTETVKIPVVTTQTVTAPPVTVATTIIDSNAAAAQAYGSGIGCPPDYSLDPNGECSPIP
jgi:carbohydrate-binding DOMON domain-containing protein